MTPDELTKAYWELYESLFTIKSILKRNILRREFVMYEVEIFDMMIETISLSEKIESYNPKIIGITSLCIDVNKVIELRVEAKGIRSDGSFF